MAMKSGKGWTAVAGALAIAFAQGVSVHAMGQSPKSNSEQQLEEERIKAEASARRQNRIDELNRQIADLNTSVRQERERFDQERGQERQEKEDKAGQEKAAIDRKAEEDKLTAATDEERHAIATQAGLKKNDVDTKLEADKREIEARLKEKHDELQNKLTQGERDLKVKIEAVNSEAVQ